MNLSGLNLNLLVVFDAVMEQRSITKAAARLGMERTATSKALSRLKAVLQDELFHEGADRKLQPSKVANELHSHISDPIKQIVAFLNARDFEPEHTTRTFHIAAGDYFSSTVLPPLLTRLSAAAPNVNISIFPVSRLDVIQQLDDGHLDFVLGWFAKLPDRLVRRVVLTDEEALVVRPDHPLLVGQATVANILSYLRLVVDLGGDPEASQDGFHHELRVLRRLWMNRFLVDAAPGEEGTFRRAAVTVPYFNAIAPIVAATDMVAILPKRLATAAAASGIVALLPLPYEPLRVGLQAIYTRTHDNDQGLKWLLDQIVATTATFS